MGILPHMTVLRHPPAGSVCLVFWADRGPGASCPYGEGPRRALVTFPRWNVTRGNGLRPQARSGVSRRRRLLGRDGAAPQENLHQQLISKPAYGQRVATRPRRKDKSCIQGLFVLSSF